MEGSDLSYNMDEFLISKNHLDNQNTLRYNQTNIRKKDIVEVRHGSIKANYL